MGEDGDGTEWEPAMAIALGPSFGTLFGIVLGLTVLDDIGLGIGVGAGLGLLAGAVVYAFLQNDEEP